MTLTNSDSFHSFIRKHDVFHSNSPNSYSAFLLSALPASSSEQLSHTRGASLPDVSRYQIHRWTVWDVNLPRAVAVLSTGDTAIISPLGATSAALTLLGLELHHLTLIQGMVEAEIHCLEQQEHGSNYTTVDSHYHHGWLQGLGLEKSRSDCRGNRKMQTVLVLATKALRPFLLYFIYKAKGMIL